ncbi:hypothetical protein FF098_001885 [Parvularcula flava]|uniref:Uncharacterized protein n=1 Tax=Aquisalinus luteolus TaxID=1566827 RepID=A0A8J3EP02_9PROT|nr:hypothetical protein [Aquisalinus luteolus]NHK26656.1 hypothetical protein [Aquisalinus luteolus]GGH93006.1 hypothetical protein GCM10011355_03830 [Aquisalinus luteolus]
MLRYVLVLIIFAVGLPLVMISLGAQNDQPDAINYGEDAFVEQQAPYSAASVSVM